MESNQEWLMFNGFIFPLLPQLYYRTDGRAGERVLFINDEEETFTISFEQGVPCLDLPRTSSAERPKIYSEYREDGRYLHQCKVLAKEGTDHRDIVCFHMELTDAEGTVHICPGQLCLERKYRKDEGVEPILLQLLHKMEPVERKTVERKEK